MLYFLIVCYYIIILYIYFIWLQVWKYVIVTCYDCIYIIYIIVYYYYYYMLLSHAIIKLITCYCYILLHLVLCHYLPFRLLLLLVISMYIRYIYYHYCNYCIYLALCRLHLQTCGYEHLATYRIQRFLRLRNVTPLHDTVRLPNRWRFFVRQRSWKWGLELWHCSIAATDDFKTRFFSLEVTTGIICYVREDMMHLHAAAYSFAGDNDKVWSAK